MKAKRFYYVMFFIIFLLCVLSIGSIFIGNKILTKKASSLMNLKLTSQVLNTQEGTLSQAKKEILKYSSLNNEAKVIVPQEKDQAKTVQEIIGFAQQDGISIASITFPSSNLGISVKGSASSGTKLSQLQPVSGINGVYEMPITVQSDSKNQITYPQLISFLQNLENNRHTAQVNQLTITPADTGDRLAFQIVVGVYIKP